MAFITGVTPKAYRNTATFGAPTWNEVDNVSKMKVGMKRDKSEGSRRTGGGMKQYMGTLLDISPTWEMLWDTGDADLAALLTAFTGNTEIDMIFLDGSQASGSHQGPRISAGFEDFSRDEDENGIVRASVSAFPGIVNVPLWFTGAA